MGQAAPLYLLGDSAGTTTVRYCAVPAGRSIWLTPGGVFCILHLDAASEDGLRACVEEALTLITSVAVEIDGVPLYALEKHLFISRLVGLTLPTDNVFGLIAGPYQGIMGGYFLIHAPMPAGQHVIHLHDEVATFDFVSDVTYVISVAAHH